MRDAEQGIADIVLPAVSIALPPPAFSEATTRSNSSSDLKECPPSLKGDEKTQAVVIPVDEKKTAAPPAKPLQSSGKPAPGKPKWKSASRWVRFKLWYNTYR